MNKNLISVLILVFITLIFFKDVVFFNKSPIPSDAIASLYHPYKDYFAKDYPRGYPFKNFLITDPVRQQYPWRANAVALEKKFQLPLWNPYNGAGEPLLGNIQSAALYPLNLFFLILPFNLGWNFLIILQPLMAGIFLYYYLINLKLSKFASLFGSVAFAFCGFNTTWLEWGNIVHAGLWLPLVLLSIDKILLEIKTQELGIKNRKILLWSSIFIFSLSSSFFAGHLQTFFYLYIFSITYFLIRWVGLKKPKKFLLIFFILNSLFVILTAVQWYPSLQLISNSARDIDQIWQKDGWFIPFAHFIQFLAPDFFGNPTTLNYWGTWNYGELTGYIGIAPFVFALTAVLVRRDKKTLFYALSLITAIIFSSENFIAKIPYILNIPFISTAQPTRLLFIIDFCLSILAALGFDHYLKNKKTVFAPIAIVGSILAMLLAVTALNVISLNISVENLATAKRNLILPLILLISMMPLSLIIYFVKKNKLFKQFIIVVFIALSTFDLIRFSTKFNTFTDKNLLFPKTKTIKFFSEQSRDYPWRFLSVDYVKDQKRILPPNLSSFDKLYTLDTYNPLLLKKYQEFAAISEWGFVDIPDFSFNRSIILNKYDSKLVDFMGVKYIATINDVQSKKLKFLFKEGDTRVYENTDVFPRAFMTYDIQTIKDKKSIARKIYDKKTNLLKTAVIEEDIPNTIGSNKNTRNKVKIIKYSENTVDIEVETEQDGLLVLTDTFYPTWNVFVDGEEQKIYRTDYSFRGVIVKKGKHKVTFNNSLL